MITKLSMNELKRKSLSEFKKSDKNKAIVVLDNIRSMHNIGSIFRTSDAFLLNQYIYAELQLNRHIGK